MENSFYSSYTQQRQDQLLRAIQAQMHAPTAATLALLLAKLRDTEAQRDYRERLDAELDPIQQTSVRLLEHGYPM